MGAVYVIYSNAEVSSGLSAGSVAISKTNMSEVPEATLQSALDYLYSKAELVGQAGCPSGYEYEANANGHGYLCNELPDITVEWATNETYLGIAYLNPTDLYATCNATLASQNLNNKSTPTPTEVKDGCMKWYIYGTDTNNDYLAILDHNTTAIVQWNTTNTNSNVAFESSVAYSYLTNLIKPVSQGGSGWILPTRIISGQEIANLTENGSWNASGSGYYFGSNAPYTSYFYMNTTQKAKHRSFSWLFDYTNECSNYGCNNADPNTYNLANKTSVTNQSYGYWTSTPYGTVGAGSNVWTVDRLGELSNPSPDLTCYGLRPVITISRSIVS